MLLNCLLGLCYFLAPVALDPATRALLHGDNQRLYVTHCELSPAPALVQCQADPDVLMRSGFE
jgi:hypothetical protein